MSLHCKAWARPRKINSGMRRRATKVAERLVPSASERSNREDWDSLEARMSYSLADQLAPGVAQARADDSTGLSRSMFQ